MTLEDLKTSIENGVLDYPLIIFQCDDSAFIPHQYLRRIVRESGKELIPISSIDEIFNVQPSLFFREVDDKLYRFFDCDTLECFSSKANELENTFIICKKVKDSISTECSSYIVKVPKLESWQIQDYVYSIATGVDTQKLDRLIKVCNGDIYRLDQELKKLVIFSDIEKPHVFDEFSSDGIFSDLSEFTIFDLSTAILKKDFNTIKSVLIDIDNIDIEPIGLQKVLTDNFRDIIAVQLAKDPQPEYFEKVFGWKKSKFWAIKYSCGVYTKSQLIKIYEFLTSINFGDIPEGQLISYLITHIISM